MSRAFRFGVSLLNSAPADEWRAECRRAEELGYDVRTPRFLLPDRLEPYMEEFAPVMERLRDA